MSSLMRRTHHTLGICPYELCRVADCGDASINPIDLHDTIGRLERFGFMDRSGAHDSVNHILRYLDRGVHVVLEFGRYGRDLAAYILVANLPTRRIYEPYPASK